MNKKYQGVLKELGPATINSEHGRITYTYIQFDDNRHTPPITIWESLDGKLNNALQSGEQLTLEVVDINDYHLIIGIIHESGSGYISKWNWKMGTAKQAMFGAIVMGIVSVIGFPFLIGMATTPIAIKMYLNAKNAHRIEGVVEAQQKLADDHPNSIVLSERFA